MTAIATTVAFDELLEVPLSIRTLEDFRAWARSEEFPSDARIDYVAGRIEVDMSPEDIWFHSAPKTELAVILGLIIKQRGLGFLGIGQTRYSSVNGELSAEPDLILVTYASLKSGRAQLVPKKSRRKGAFIEISGAADLVVEIVSDTSAHKDLKRLPPAYFAAGVGEFWLIDVRPGKFLFQIHRRGKTRWQNAATRNDGSQRSQIFDRWYRLEQHEEADEIWTYDLIETE